MNCARCGRSNRAGARFCGGCGTPLAPRCPACGTENEPGAQFCDACGAPLAAHPARVADEAEARKVVTVVFADLVGSTSLHERLDAESARRLMDRYYRTLRSVVEAHGGTVVKLLGDGVLAAFGVPRVAEDDAIRAVRAAVAMGEAVAGLAVARFGEEPPGAAPTANPLFLRVGVNTGEVVVSADNADVVGDPVNVAARLQQAAADGEVLIGESTRRLVSELVTLAPCGTLTLKGRSETVAAYRIVSLERPAAALATAFVGREDELRRIRAVYDAAVTVPACRLAVILGSPGLGKSRLLGELAHRLGDTTTVLVVHCDSAGGPTFAPLAKAVRMLLALDDGVAGDALRAAIGAVVPGGEAERARIAAGMTALLVGTPGSPEETFFVVRRFLAGLTATRPVLLAIDDLQWAEPLLLDLVEHLVEWGAGVPLLVLAAARPELRDVRSSLAAASGVVAEVVALAGLDAGAATRLAANVIGADALPAAVAGRVLAASEGNPLFVGELVRMLVNDGVLAREGDRWTTSVAVADLDMPPTIHALLAARIERLRPEDRTVLERAAVVGRVFCRSAVAHLLPGDARIDLDARLESLRRSELIEGDSAWFLGEPALRFHHGLVRDAAYRRLLKGTRAEQHGRLADWIEARVGDAVEYDEMIGWHLEQAHQYRLELGPIDEGGRAFGDRAARYLAAAGRRALARDDVSVAASLFGRALDQLDAADPTRADLALDWCEALLAAGNVAHAKAAIDELGRFIAGAQFASPTPTDPRPPTPNPRLSAWHTCFSGQLAVLTDPQALRATIDAVAGAASDLATAGDAAGEAKAHWVHAQALVRLGQVGACEAALDRALAAARRAGDRRRANAVLAGAPLAALWGPSPVTRASGRCLDVVRVLRITQSAPAVEAVALRCQAVLEALRGRTDAARRMLASSRRMVEELGIIQQLLESEMFAGLIDLLELDGGAAEHCLRAAYDGLRSHGLGIDAARAAALLGRAVLAQGRAAEAEELSHESEALAGDDLKAAIAWRGVRAEALARRGEHAAAVELARAAVDIAAATDALLDHADARLALAAALRAADRSAEADAEEARAIELWEAKGATLLVERVRSETPSVSSRRRGEASLGSPLQKVEEAARRARHVRSNAATANIACLDAAFARRDADALPSLFADRVDVVHHPTGAVYDRQGVLFSLRSLLAARDLTYRHEPLATLGDALLLCLLSTSFSALPSHDFGPFGAVEKESILLIEVDANGRQRWAEFFAAGRLGDAVARLYERYANLVPDGLSTEGSGPQTGPARARATATARSVAALLGPLDFDCYATAIAPSVEFADHRTIGFPSGRGAEELLRSLRTLVQTADDSATRVDDILALRPDSFLVRWTTSGTDRVSRGAFEWQFLRLCVFGADGLLGRAEQFDADRADEALARFDELVLSSVDGLTAEVPAARFANAATRATERFRRCWSARDWDGLVALFAPTFRMDDRRALVGFSLSGEDFLANLRMMFDMPASRWGSELRATRGTRLALFHSVLTGKTGTKGVVEFEHLSLLEVDATGHYAALILFDAGDLDAAYSELDDRYAAGEAAPYAGVWGTARRFQRAVAARDWEQLTSVFTPDLVVEDHRLLGWGMLRSRDELLARLRALVEVASNAILRFEHVLALSEQGTLEVAGWRGGERGKSFEIPWASVATMGPEGRIRRLQAYDLDQLDVARRRFNELSATGFSLPQGEGTGQARIETAATRTVDRVRHAWKVRDWEGFAALLAKRFHHSDRRTLVQLDLERDQYLESIRPFFEAASSAPTIDVLATRGDRLVMVKVLVRVAQEGSGDLASGASEFEFIGVIEVDDVGDQTTMVQFDPDDLDAAYAELDRRDGASEAVSQRRAALTREFTQAFAARDWDTLATLLAPDLVFDDHRLLGWETLHGPAAYIQALRSLVDLAPDVRLRIDHVTMSAPRFLYMTTWQGTRDGGEFESPSAIVCELDATGRIRRFDQYDLDQLDEAKAHFAAGGGRNPLGTADAAVNAALRARGRVNDAFMAGDWATLRSLASDGFVFEDRRKWTVSSGGVEMWLKSKEVVRSAPGVTFVDEPIGTVGDRIALQRRVVTGVGPDGGVFESEFILLTEIDANGRLTASINFDLEARVEAFAEAYDRFVAGEAAAVGGQAPIVAFNRAIARHDWKALQECLAADAVIRDRRTLGLGTFGRDEWIESLRAQAKLAPHLEAETLRILAWNSHGRVDSMRIFGTARDGGPFEKVFVAVYVVIGRHIHHHEVFDVADVDRALARFEELCATQDADASREGAPPGHGASSVAAARRLFRR